MAKLTKDIEACLYKLQRMTDLWEWGGDIGRPEGFFVIHKGGCFRLWVDAWIDQCLEDVCPVTPKASFDLAVKRAKALAKKWGAKNKKNPTGVWTYDPQTKPYAVTWEIFPVKKKDCEASEDYFADDDIIDLR